MSLNFILEKHTFLALTVRKCQKSGKSIERKKLVTINYY